MPEVSRPLHVFREMGRYRQILGVLIKYGFGELLDEIHIWEHTNVDRHLFHRQPHKIAHLTFPQRVVTAITELGPTFIKFGQMMATRPDLFSPELVSELEKLFDSVNFLPTEVIKEAIETELKHPLAESFKEFDNTPIGAASLAQVHKAVLLSGEIVAIKIQRPNIQKQIEVDIEIIRQIFSLLERNLTQASLINLVALADEFAEDLKRELDFEQEKNNLKLYAENFKDYPAVRVPKVYDSLCTERMIVMEYLDGINITDVERLKSEHYDLKQIAIYGVNIMLKSILEDGFFHADPHPGNMFVLPGNKIGVIDFGMMSSMSQRNQLRVIRLLYAIWTRDEKKTAQAIDELMEAEAIVSPDELEEGVAGILNRNTRPSGGFFLGSLLFDLIKLINSHKAPFNRHLLWITKSIATIESISSKLQVELNILDDAKVYAYRTLLDRIDPTHELGGALFWVSEAVGFLEDFPREARLFFRQLTKGKTQIEFKHVGLEPTVNKLSQTINGLSMVIFIGLLLLSSSILVMAGIPPHVWDIPLIGLIGLILSAILIVVLFYSFIFRNR